METQVKNLSNLVSKLRSDKTSLTGLGLLALSIIAFLLTVDNYEIDFDIFTGTFFLTYGLTVVYLIVVMASNRQEFGRIWRFKRFAHNILLLELFNISAYSLNRSITVFDISVTWLIVLLIISNVTLLIYAFAKDILPVVVRHVFVIIAAIALLFNFYESLYVAQGYVVAALGFWFFGIALHILIPALFVVAFGKVIRDNFRRSEAYAGSFAFGLAMTIALISYTSYRFDQVNNIVHKEFHSSVLPGHSSTLPSWVRTSQNLQKDWFTERALKAGLVYSTIENQFNFMGGEWDERSKHDPLVVIASFFNEDMDLNDDDRIKILQTMYNARHKTERRLWSGDNLSTTDIATHVQLFPEYRMSYTEKTFKIKNIKVDRWGGDQEALYTFHLPEGSVVTSGSLWINGKEEPAYLTTKEKADSAYTTIVGREQRDPMLVHWQEGNRITVRVFPCSPEEDRQFKIGITSPLKKSKNQLQYHNIDFEGPYWENAVESIHVFTSKPMANFSSNIDFKEIEVEPEYLGEYRSDWWISMTAPPLNIEPFTFLNQSFSMSDYVRSAESFTPEAIYLDINAAWGSDEIDNILRTFDGTAVYASDDGKIVRFGESNRQTLTDKLRQRNFDLFPFNKISNAQNSLIITKFNQLTPCLSDLDDCRFVEDQSNYFKENSAHIRVANLGDEVSPYLKTLNEMRAVHLEVVSADELMGLIQNKQFYAQAESKNKLVNNLGSFGISMREVEPDSTISQAPDHLMRFFAYNDVLRDVGRDYFNKKQNSHKVIEKAKKANVVTPISSLIVLESQADYDRFDIQKSKDSLGNASISNSGAVPEPHEWVLIVLVLLFTFRLFRKRG